jgi:SSS family solute:Na+ symporter
MKVLKYFYKSVRPWGFWKPVLWEVQKENPDFLPNAKFGRDMLNVVIGIVWQMALVVWPIFLMIKNWDALAISLLVGALTTLMLKYLWYDPLKKEAT